MAMMTSVVMAHSKFYLMLTLVVRFLIATVGRQIPSSTCFLMETLNFEKISGYLQQNVLKLVTSLSYRKPCLTSLQVSLWCLVKKPL